MASISICDYRSQEVGVRDIRSLGFWRCDPLFPLLAVVEKLCHKELLHFVWDRVLFSSASVALSTGHSSVPLGNLQGRERAHQSKKQLRNTASQKHRPCRDTWPFG